MDTPEITPAKPTDEKRRSIVRGGLAVPVVLGTLASKQALGGGAAYGCSVSGKWSGGSAHGAPPDCHVGDSCEQVKENCRESSTHSCDHWGGTLGIKGDCQKYSGDTVWRDGHNNSDMNKCGKPMRQAGFSGNHGCYRKQSRDGHWYRCGPSYNAVEMTCYEVLCQEPDNERTELCREAVCASYNAEKYSGQGYPCSKDQVRIMVNDCLDFGSVKLSKCFNVSDSNASWSTRDVIAFFKGCRKGT
jgi:hypothetical protein